MNGAYFVSGAGADKFAKIMGGLSGLGGEVRNDYDNPRSSYCVLGTGNLPDYDPNNPNQPVTAKIAGLMATVPRGSIPYPDREPLTASNAATNECVAAIGVDTLNRLHAICIDGATVVMIQAPQVEILLESMPANVPNTIPVPSGAAYQVLKHLLKRYAP